MPSAPSEKRQPWKAAFASQSAETSPVAKNRQGTTFGFPKGDMVIIDGNIKGGQTPDPDRQVREE